MNINPVSFKGTFAINRCDLTEKKLNKIFDRQSELRFLVEHSCYQNPEVFFLHLPDELDVNLMKLLSKLSVGYNRIDEHDSLSEESIVSRMILNPSVQDEGKVFLQTINVSKLDSELKKNNENYVGINGANGSGAKYDRFKRYLKTNQQIKSPNIYLKKSPQGVITTSIYDGRHRFAVLRDLGFQKIPVTMSKESGILAKEIGLI